jgi:microcystin-dependent protein
MPIPIGSIVNYCINGDLDPGNFGLETWMPCESSSPVSVSEFPVLDAVIGETFGGTSSQPDTPQFYLPDLRGRFIRAPDTSPMVPGSAGRDLDAAARVSMFPNGNTGQDVGSVQADAVGPHSHELDGTYGVYWNGDNPSIKCNYRDGVLIDARPTTVHGPGGETRPVNLALRFIILADNAAQHFPIGSVISYAGPSDPPVQDDGDTWLICDGRSFEKSDFQPFYDALSSVLSNGPDPGTFFLPDLRGIFMRGATPFEEIDAGGDVDTGLRSRTIVDNKLGNRSVGSLQDDVFASHSHQLQGTTTTSWDKGGNEQRKSADGSYDSSGLTETTGQNLGSDTHPKNVYLHQIIRVK